jgi:hypothetical protein
MNLSSLLVQRGVATIREVEEALARQVLYGGDFVTNLLEVARPDEAALLDVWAETIELPPGPVGELPLAGEALASKLGAQNAVEYMYFPIEALPERLVVLVAEKVEIERARSVATELMLPIEFRAALPLRLKVALARTYGVPLERRLERLLRRLSRPASVPPPALLDATLVAHSGEPEAEADRTVPQDEFAAARGTVDGTFKTDDAVDPAILAAPSDDTFLASAPAPEVALRPTPQEPSAPPAPPADEEPISEAPVTAVVPEPILLPEAFADAPNTVFVGRTIATQSPVPTAIEPVVAARIADPHTATTLEMKAWPAGVAAAMSPRGAVEATASKKPTKRRKGPFGLKELDEDLADVDDRDAILDAFVAYSRQFFEYIALFVVQGDVAEGRDGFGRGASRDRVVQLGFPLEFPSILHDARAKKQMLIRGLGTEGVDAQLADDLERPRGVAALAAPIAVRGRVVAMLYADDDGAPIDGPAVTELPRAAILAGRAFERILLRRKLMKDPSQHSEAAPGAPLRTEGRAAGAASPATALADDPQDPPGPRGATTVEGPARLQPPANFLVVAARETAGPIEKRPATIIHVAWQPGDSAELTGHGTDEKGRSAMTTKRNGGDDVWVPGAPAPKSTRDGRPAPAAADDDEVWSPGAPAPVAAEPDEDVWTPGVPAARPSGAVLKPDLLAAAEQLATKVKVTASDSSPPASERHAGDFSASMAARRPPPSTKMVVEQSTIILEVEHAHADVVRAALAGSEDAISELFRLGPAAMPALMAEFPGPVAEVSVDKALPRASECGPVLKLIAKMRKAALPYVLDHADGKDVTRRFWATLLLAELPYVDAIEIVIARTMDESLRVRNAARYAARALAEIQPRATVDRLAKFSTHPQTPIDERRWAIEALGDVGEPLAVPVLISTLERQPEELCDASQKALVRLTLVDYKQDARKWSSWWASNIGRHRIEWLIDSLLHDDEQLRQRGARELGTFVKKPIPLAAERRDREQAHLEIREWWMNEGRLRYVRES